MRRSLSPGAAITAFCAAMELDVRDILPAVRVPTLVFPRPVMPEAGYYVAEHIKDAQVVALPEFAVSTPGPTTTSTKQRWKRPRISFRGWNIRTRQTAS